VSCLLESQLRVLGVVLEARVEVLDVLLQQSLLVLDKLDAMLQAGVRSGLPGVGQSAFGFDLRLWTSLGSWGQGSKIKRLFLKLGRAGAG